MQEPLRESMRFPGRSSRPGSVLVLILGTLALMTVLAVVYVGIGKGDRQTSAAVLQREENERIPRQVAEYIADVIAEDALATFPTYEGVQDGAPTTALRREAWDAPTSDPLYRSSPLRAEASAPNPSAWVSSVQGAIPGNLDAMQIEVLRFRPSGTHPVRLDDAALLGQGVVNALRSAIDFDRRVGSDPWLASSEPVNLDLHLAPNQRDEDNLNPPPAHPNAVYAPAQEQWYYARDILQMSNFAPDGRAVNLFNLRNNFDASSLIGDPNDGLASISDNLTLFGPEGLPYAVGSQQLLWDGVTEADPNRPDHWFTNQRGAFRALSDVDRSWAAPEYLPYQYADADGDGMVDSRWIELIDASDPDNPISILDDDGQFRYFVAIRAEDLSSRVNANIARAEAIPPTPEEPAGFTPADIALSRLLNLEDAWQDTLWAYSGLEPPRLANGTPDLQSPANYASYDPFNNRTGAALLGHIGQAGYDAMSFAQFVGEVPPSDIEIRLDVPADELFLYAANVYGILPEGSRPFAELIPGVPLTWRHSAQGRALWFAQQAALGVGSAFDDPSGGSDNRMLSDNAFDLASLSELLTYRGVNDPQVTSDLESALDGRYDGDTGAFEGFETTNLGPMRSNRDLRSERGDRDAFDWLFAGGIGGGGGAGGSPDGETDADALLWQATDLRQRITTHSWALPRFSSVLTDPESVTHLTEEQANELQLAAFVGAPDGSFTPAVSELRSHIARDTIFERQSWQSDQIEYFQGPITVPLLDNPKAIFELYADALLPYSGVPGAWPRGGPGFGGAPYNADGLHYGYRGPEFALRTSAHMAVNLSDMLDEDDIPTAATLLIDERAFNTLNNDEERVPSERVNAWSFWPSVDDPEDASRRVAGMKFDLNRDRNGDGDRGGEEGPASPEARLANSGGRSGETPDAAVINVFGIEAQPFITEASTLFAYHDTPSAGVSTAFPPGDDDLTDPIMPDPTDVVTIDFGIRDQNPDFLFWVIAVQLTNPFDRPVHIGRYVGDPDDPNDRSALYYLELNGNYFPLAGVPLDCYDYSDNSCLGNPDGTNGGGPGGGGGASNELWSNPGIVINPGESKVFVIPSQPLWYIEDRLEHRLGIDGTASKDITQIGEILKVQFGRPDSDQDDDASLGTDESNIVILDPPLSASEMTLVPFPTNQYQGAQTDTTMIDIASLLAAPPGQALGSEIPYELRLWRVMRPASFPKDPNADPSTPERLPIREFRTGQATNIIENDLLVDRMRTDVFNRGNGGGIGGGGAQPWFSVLDRRLNDPNALTPTSIDGASTWLGENDQSILSEDTYDGLALISYATVSRPRDEAQNAGDPLPRRVPWFAMEAKHQWRDWNSNTLPTWNTVDFEGDVTDVNGRRSGWTGFPDVDDVGEIDNHLYEQSGDTRVMAFRRGPFDSGGLCRNGFETMVRILADDFAELNRPGTCDVGADAYRATTTGIPVLEKEDAGWDPTEFAPNLFGNDLEDLSLELATRLDRDALRPADFLLPMGIGAWYDPDLPNGGANPEWTTLSEMLARTLGFDEPDPPVGDVYQGLGALRTQTQIAQTGDSDGNGLNDELEGTVNRPPLDKGHLVLDDFVPFLSFGDPQQPLQRYNPAAGDIRFGMGIPPALALLDHLRTLFGDPAIGPNALEHPVPGRINLNTASRAVLRTLPLLSPSLMEWWGELTHQDPDSDIASTIAAYRDKLAILPRPPSGISLAGGAIDFAEFDALSAEDDVARQNVTIVSALHEDRGLRSPAEVALAHVLGGPDGSGRTLDNQARTHNIDRLGYDDQTLGAMEGIESIRYERVAGMVRNNQSPQNQIVGDLGLSDSDDAYNNWTLTFLKASDPALLDQSYVIRDYDGRTRTMLLSGNMPANPSAGDLFILRPAVVGTVRFFDPSDPQTILASGPFDPDANYAGWTITLLGSGMNAGTTYTVGPGAQGGMGLFRVTSAIVIDSDLLRPVIGNTFVLRPPDYGNDLPGDWVREDDNLSDDYEERLSIVNAVMNTASVRSDLFAVWFLLHGYQESDVEGLASDEPLLPTIQRRFVMVVDRSNVRKKGDKARILLFREVPL